MSAARPPVEEQMQVLMRGVEYGDRNIQATMEEELRARLAEGRPLRVYAGFDPTAVDLHLGHIVPMMKLRQFQDLGHEVTFLIGTMTAMIGDPTDRTSARIMQTPAQVEEMAKTWIGQAFRILDPDKTVVKRNGDWLTPMTLADFVSLASNFTVQQFLDHDTFKRRIEAQRPIYLHEFVYALMQGYDAVAMNTDVQVGGTEQLFNMFAGRILQQRAFEQKPHIAICLPILIGTDGTQRMSKSTGNYIGLDDSPTEMYGKVMSIPDSLIVNYFTLLVPDSDVPGIERGLADGSLKPMETKKSLAHAIVSLLNDEPAADAAQREWERTHQSGEALDVVLNKPLEALIEELFAANGRRIEIRGETGRDSDDIKEIRVPFSDSVGFDLPPDWGAENNPGINLLSILVDTKMAESRSEARRLIRQGGVKVNNARFDKDVLPPSLFTSGTVVQIGRHRFLRIVDDA